MILKPSLIDGRHIALSFKIKILKIEELLVLTYIWVISKFTYIQLIQ